jgi:maltose O-acetyltransferase
MNKIKHLLNFVFSILKMTPLRCIEIIGQLFPENTAGCKIRGVLYKPFLKECGKNFQIGLGAKLEFLHNITVKDNVYVGHNSWISGLNGGVILEDEVMIGPFVKMVSSNHTFQKGSARFSKSIGARILINKGCWLASGVVVTAGVEIGKSSLIAAGSIVTKNQPANSVIAGVPAKVIKQQPN